MVSVLTDTPAVANPILITKKRSLRSMTSCGHQPRLGGPGDGRWEMGCFFCSSVARPVMHPCHAIRIPIIERLFMPLSSQTAASCDHGRTILQSHLPPRPGRAHCPPRPLTRCGLPCMSPPWPTSPSRRGQGPKRASATTSKPPVCLVNAFTLVVLHGHEGPKHQGVASSPSSRHHSGEWAQLGLIRCRKPCFCSPIVL